ncbi:MAG: hypothetical protein R2865_05540 [Deinococcales bacterium]
MTRDEHVIILGEDVGNRGGVFLATDGLYAKYGETRVIDTPLNEAAILGAALGMAVNGLRPVAEIQFADYIFGIDQLFSQAAKMRYLVAAVLCANGGAHARPVAESRVVITIPKAQKVTLSILPGLKSSILQPYDAKGLLKSAIRDDDPVIFYRTQTPLSSRFKNSLPREDYTVPIGKAISRQQGDDVVIISYGGNNVRKPQKLVKP